MDSIFGANRFQNEIIWCYGLGGSSRKRFSRKHDNLLFYSKSSQYTFFKPMIAATSQKLRGRQKGATDVWDMPSLNNMAHERTGYPTQKPLALLERIIRSCSGEGDLVLDPFCGSGTALVAAELLQRRWCGIDNSCSAVATSMQRLKALKTENRTSFRKSVALPHATPCSARPVPGETQRDALFDMQQERCNLCLSSFENPTSLQTVRIVSEKYGGVEHPLNVQLLCPTCRDLKKTCTQEEAKQRVETSVKLKDLYLSR